MSVAQFMIGLIFLFQIKDVTHFAWIISLYSVYGY